MALFQANRQKENDKKTRISILGELNKLKDSVSLFTQERLSAEIVLAGKESDTVSSELTKVPHVLKEKSPSIHSLGKESDMKPKVGIKRPHPDPQFSHSSPKVPHVSSPPRVPKKEPPTTHSLGKEKPEVGIKQPHRDPQFSHLSHKTLRMSSAPRIPKKESPTTHSLGKKSDEKPEVGIKRPHPDPQFSRSTPKIPRISSTAVVDNNQPAVIDLTTEPDSEEDEKPTSKPGHTASNVAEIGGVMGKTSMKTFTVSSSDKTVGGYVPKVDKPPTSLTTMKKEGLPTPESVKSTKASKQNVPKKRKQPLKRPPGPASSNVATSPGRVKPSGKRIRKSRCAEKVKKYCSVCSKPDCGECKNCR
jgi:hypothetical protein